MKKLRQNPELSASAPDSGILLLFTGETVPFIVSNHWLTENNYL